MTACDACVDACDNLGICDSWSCDVSKIFIIVNNFSIWKEVSFVRCKVGQLNTSQESRETQYFCYEDCIFN